MCADCGGRILAHDFEPRYPDVPAVDIIWMSYGMILVVRTVLYTIFIEKKIPLKKQPYFVGDDLCRKDPFALDFHSEVVPFNKGRCPFQNLSQLVV